MVGHTLINASVMSLALDKLQGSGVGHTLNTSVRPLLGPGMAIANKSIILPADKEIIGSS
jgi:hypothetical protein